MANIPDNMKRKVNAGVRIENFDLACLEDKARKIGVEPNKMIEYVIKEYLKNNGYY